MRDNTIQAAVRDRVRQQIDSGFELKSASPLDVEIKSNIMKTGCVIAGSGGCGKTNLVKVIARELMHDENIQLKIFDKSQNYIHNFDPIIYQDIDMFSLAKKGFYFGDQSILFNCRMNTPAQMKETLSSIIGFDYDYQWELKQIGQMDRYLAYIIEECYSDDTEVLTEHGFKLFKDISLTEKIATLNPTTNYLEYQYPTDKIEREYDGEMFHQGGRFIDLLVTPNHNLWVKRWESRMKPNEYQYHFVTAKDLGKNYYRFQTVAFWDGEEKKFFYLPSTGVHSYGNRKWERPQQELLMDNFLKILGIYLAEGNLSAGSKIQNHYNIEISKTDEKSKQLIAEWIRNVGQTPSICDRKVVFTDKQWFIYLKQFGRAWEKYIPTELKTLSTRQLDILLDAYLMGDGFKNEYGYYGMGSTSHRLRDDMMECLLKTGRYGKGWTYYKKPTDTIPTPRPFYCSSINRKGGHEPFGFGRHREWTPYHGKVYCLKVPNHIIYVRRNGKSVWCGNCQNILGTIGLNDIWNTFISEGRNFNMSFIFITRRMAQLSPKAREQTQSYLWGRTVSQLDLDRIRRVSTEEVAEALPTLNLGEFLYWDGEVAYKLVGVPKFESTNLPTRWEP